MDYTDTLGSQWGEYLLVYPWFTSQQLFDIAGPEIDALFEFEAANKFPNHESLFFSHSKYPWFCYV